MFPTGLQEPSFYNVKCHLSKDERPCIASRKDIFRNGNIALLLNGGYITRKNAGMLVCSIPSMG